MPPGRTTAEDASTADGLAVRENVRPDDSRAENAQAENTVQGENARAGDTQTEKAGAGDTQADDTQTGDTRADDTQTAGDRAAPGRLRRAAGRVATGLAAFLVLFALIAPNELALFTPAAFARVPVEALVAVALLLVLPPRARRVTAALLGGVLGVLAVLKLLDIGFQEVVVKPFDPVLDWILFYPTTEFLADVIGWPGAIAVMAAAALLAVAVLVYMPFAVLRLTRVAHRHRTASAGTVAVLGAVALVCTLLGVPVMPEQPVAGMAYDRVAQINRGLHDKEAFAREAASDAFRKVPATHLLSALQGKDVVFAFVESYGRDAVQDPEFATQIGAMLDDGTRRLSAAGYGARSGWLTSPTIGGRSYLAHATLLSGLWVDNQQRYRNLVSSDRMTVNSAFRKARWRTVAIAPGVRRAWPEASFFRFNRVYASWDFKYRGPKFAWAPVPDQFVLSEFERLEHGRKGRPQVMAEIPLVSSHAPWTPLPRLLGWDQLGDGSVFDDIAEGQPSHREWRSTTKLRADYRRSIEYTVGSIISYVEKYGDDNLVLVFLGDHQPIPAITGPNPNFDVPITIVARDRKILDRVAAWNWTEGLKPGPTAPVWPMNEFRDRFFAAYTEATPTPKPH